MSPGGSDGRCLAAKKAKSVTEEFRSGVQGGKKRLKVMPWSDGEVAW